MSPTLYDLLLVALSALLSWFLTHRYYLKSLRSQEEQATKEISELTEALKKANAASNASLKQEYVEGALKEWKRKGQAVDYLNSIDIPDNEKAEIFRAAFMRHKGREPKRNPFIEEG